MLDSDRLELSGRDLDGFRPDVSYIKFTQLVYLEHCVLVTGSIVQQVVHQLVLDRHAIMGEGIHR
jgi:hypothetical protein